MIREWVDVEDACSECGVAPRDGRVAPAILESDRGEARWDCDACGEENLIHLGWGYSDLGGDDV